MSNADWHAIVIGSGMGGLACAAALSRCGHRVLVLEQHAVAGGLTHTFRREGYAWNVGVHYIGGMGAGERPRALLDWLTDGGVEMSPIAPPYDVMHFPGDFELRFLQPETTLRDEFKSRFPGSAAAIDGFFDATAQAERAALAVFRERALPGSLSRLHALWHHKEIEKWCNITTAEVLERLVHDSKLGAVLASQWLNYGVQPAASSFAIHAIVMRSFMNGAYYPTGGAGAFAAALAPVIEQAGGAVRTGAQVVECIVADGRVTGVRLKSGECLSAPHVVSDAGARSTIVRLLPGEMWYSTWAQEVLSFKPSACHIGLYLGLEGEIEAAGASASNQWFHETWDGDATWNRPGDRSSTPPVTFVSFPTLKDPRHEPGERARHTAEIIALTRWEPFARWEDSSHGKRPAEYADFKRAVEENLLAQFRKLFPRIAPMIRYHEISTPLTTNAFTGAREGSIYGLATSPARFMSSSLRAATPVPGLHLAGQDVATPGVVGAMMGGLMAAASIDPRLHARLG